MHQVTCDVDRRSISGCQILFLEDVTLSHQLCLTKSVSGPLAVSCLRWKSIFPHFAQLIALLFLCLVRWHFNVTSSGHRSFPGSFQSNSHRPHPDVRSPGLVECGRRSGPCLYDLASHLREDTWAYFLPRVSRSSSSSLHSSHGRHSHVDLRISSILGLRTGFSQIVRATHPKLPRFLVDGTSVHWKPKKGDAECKFSAKM